MNSAQMQIKKQRLDLLHFILRYLKLIIWFLFAIIKRQITKI